MKKIIIDIDGTVAQVGGRIKYLKEEPTNWDAFYDACFEDQPIMEVINMLKALENQYEFIFCTGRRESVRSQTERWLENYGLFGIVLMRPDGDFRHDTQVKPEQLELASITKEDIAFVLEDRNSMVKQWRSMGLKCLQVADGDF